MSVKRGEILGGLEAKRTKTGNGHLVSADRDEPSIKGCWIELHLIDHDVMKHSFVTRRKGLVKVGSGEGMDLGFPSGRQSLLCEAYGI